MPDQRADARGAVSVKHYPQNTDVARGATSPDQGADDRLDSLVAGLVVVKGSFNPSKCDRVIAFQKFVKIFWHAFVIARQELEIHTFA